MHATHSDIEQMPDTNDLLAKFIDDIADIKSKINFVAECDRRSQSERDKMAESIHGLSSRIAVSEDRISRNDYIINGAGADTGLVHSIRDLRAHSEKTALEHKKQMQHLEEKFDLLSTQMIKSNSRSDGIKSLIWWISGVLGVLIASITLWSLIESSRTQEVPSPSERASLFSEG